MFKQMEVNYLLEGRFVSPPYKPGVLSGLKGTDLQWVPGNTPEVERSTAPWKNENWSMEL